MSETPHHAGSHGAHETTDVHVRPLVTYTGVLVLTVAGALVLMWVLFQFYAAMPVREGGPVSPLTAERVPPPRPRLQTMETQSQDLVSNRATEEQLLNSYGWVDQSAGIVRIPIRRAMDLAVERGLVKSSSEKGSPEKK
jgi:hypothetical protein